MTKTIQGKENIQASARDMISRAIIGSTAKINVSQEIYTAEM